MSDALPSASVIVPVYDGEATLGECLDSLLGLDYPAERLEIIIVDNGSTDGTERILERFRGGQSGEQGRVVLFESVRGPGAARNRGIREARHEVLAFTDADCTVSPDWLTHLVRPLADPEVGVAAGRILAKRPATAIQRFSEILDDHEAATGARIPGAITMNWASPAALIRDMGGFDEAMTRGEDSDLAFRIFLGGGGFRYVPEAVVYHSNPSRLGELLAEGYHHGVASVVLDKKHDEARRSLGVPRLYLGSYLELAGDAIRALRGDHRTEAACALVFGTGKKLGRAVGSLRYRHLFL